MRHMNIYARCLALLLAALMLTGMLAVAETKGQEGAEANPSYDIVYSSNNPIPEIAERVRPAIVQLNTKQESWDPQTRVAKVEDAVKVGDEVKVKVLSVDPEKKRISLSIRQVMEDEAFNYGEEIPGEAEFELVSTDDLAVEE